MKTKQSKSMSGTNKNPLLLLVLLIMTILFMACEEAGWIIADIPPMLRPPAIQPTGAQPNTAQPVGTQPIATQPTAAQADTTEPLTTPSTRAQPTGTETPTVQPGLPPFVISKPVVDIYERFNSFKYAGIVFKFLNNSERYVEKIKICFMLFDTKTQTSPFIGSNKFEITKYDFISPGENREISISLDQYIYIAPAEPYLIDFFYISEISYIDGAVWQDTYGKYRVRW